MIIVENQQEEENDLHLINEKKGIKYFGKLGRNEIKTEEEAKCLTKFV